jgi:hypothetical protein
MNLGKLGLWMISFFMLRTAWIVFDMTRPAKASLVGFRSATLPVLVEFMPTGAAHVVWWNRWSSRFLRS